MEARRGWRISLEDGQATQMIEGDEPIVEEMSVWWKARWANAVRTNLSDARPQILPFGLISAQESQQHARVERTDRHFSHPIAVVREEIHSAVGGGVMVSHTI